MLYVAILILQLTLGVFILFLCLSFVTGAPFVPATNSTARAMIELARIKPGEIVYDLGSGDGKVLFLAAKKGATAYGFEINPVLVLYTRVRALFSPFRSSVRVLWKDLWVAQVDEANVVFIYLLPWRMKELQRKLTKSLKPGTRIVSNSFMFPDLPVEDEDRTHHAYLYRQTNKSLSTPV